jgi:hypothetical protein
MTVKQLIECLKQCPEEGEVLIYGPYQSLELTAPSLDVDITNPQLERPGLGSSCNCGAACVV